jgi:hypothetical protein
VLVITRRSSILVDELWPSWGSASPVVFMLAAADQEVP